MSVASPSPRSEPLLWLQLLAIGFLPLEALLLLLLLGAGDPGPLPALERSLCWAIGVLAPAVLLWRFPVDPWSLLVVQVPRRGRRELQQRLSSLQLPRLLSLGSLVGLALLSLVLLWWCDDHAAFASAFSPVVASPRLVGLLLAALLLAVLQWQGQQVVQALWLLSRSPQEVAAASPLPAAALEQERLSLGLPLLLLPSLRGSLAAAPIPASVPFSESSKAAVEGETEAAFSPGPADRSVAAADAPTTGPSREAEAVPWKPEEPAEVRSQTEAEAHLNEEAGAQPEAPIEAEVPALSEVPLDAEDRVELEADTEAPDHPSPAAAAPDLESSLDPGPTDAAESIASGAAPEDPLEGFSSPSAVAAAVAVEPEQPTEEQQGPALDQQIG